MAEHPTPGQLIRDARLTRGETLVQLAARTGIDPGSLSRMERGLREIYRPSRVLLAAALDLDEEALKTDSPAPAGAQ